MLRRTSPLFALAVVGVACGNAGGGSVDDTGGEEPEGLADGVPAANGTADAGAEGDEAPPIATPETPQTPEDPVPTVPATPTPSDSIPTPPVPVPVDDTLLAEMPDAGFADECEREIVFEAVELSEPPPFDVVIVADHSDSLSWSRDDLSRGLGELLANVRGVDARFFILTPTQYGASSVNAVDVATGNDLVNWSDPVTGEAYQNAVTEYSHACWDDLSQPMPCPSYPEYSIRAFTMDGRWDFRMPEPIAQITRSMTEQELAAQQAAISDAILNLAGSGSLQEQPLCTLNRYVSQPAENLPSNAIFIVLSDEDDITTPEECLVSHHYERVAVNNGAIQLGCTSDCDGYRYHATAPRPGYDLKYRCVPVDDQGNTFPEQAVEGSMATNASEDCTTVTSIECRPADISRIEAECGTDVLIEDCEVVCTPGAGSTDCGISLAEHIDACSTGFELEGVQYANLLEYCTEQWQTDAWESCEYIDGYWVIGEGSSFSDTQTLQPLTPGSQTQDLVNQFRLVADGAFDTGKYFVEVIGFAPQFSCTPEEGQSYAATLSTLASTPEDVFAICDSYAPALDRVEQFAGTLLATEYSLELTSLEEIEAVRVTNTGGQERELAEGDFSYDELSQTLVLNQEAIEASDVSLTVEVARNCIPNAR